MYLRTPKRYRPGRHRRQLRLFSARSVVLLVLIGGLAYGGAVIWLNQQQLRDRVLPQLEGVAEAVQTQVAPKPTPTATPDIYTAQTSCNNARAAGIPNKIITDCRDLAESSPNDVSLHFELAHLMVLASNFGTDGQMMADALAFAERTINANPEAPHGWAARAMVQDWLGDYGGALASALHAQALDDDFAPTYAFLGSIYFELGKSDLALTYLKRARELDTSGLVIADTFRTEGWIYENQANYEDAQRAYRTALEYAPNQTYLSSALASIYLRLDEPELAFDELERALDRNSEDPLILFTIGRAYVNTGNPERGEEYYRRCLDYDADNALCTSYLGGLQHSQGDYASATNTLQRAIELGSTDLWDYYQLGHSYASLGQCSQGLPYLREGYQKATADNQPDETLIDFLADQLAACGDITTAIQDESGPSETDLTDQSADF